MTAPPLPIDPHLADIQAAVRRARAAVITAPPGAGKTTRIPPVLASDGPVIVLQPRRVAARAIARRIATERGWELGREVGWQVRLERLFSARTRVLIVTEGILTARLQGDPLLSAFMTVVLDEFHERSIHADLALALTREAWHVRDDLRIVVMSATIDTEPLAAFLGECPVITVGTRTHPVDVRYEPGVTMVQAVSRAARETAGDVLCFLPGAGEIVRAAMEIEAGASGFELLPLHGSLASEQQDRVFSPARQRRIVLATNIAETSITVPRVGAVVDTGLQKVARYDAARGIDSLSTERVTTDSADQRAGRAGREGPGIAVRLWDSRDRLRPHREPEIARVDLASAALEVFAWGGDPQTLDWFEHPPSDALKTAVALLSRIGAIAAGRVTPLGARIGALPVHPRLGRILAASGGAWEAAIACAVLSERTFIPGRPATATTCDLLGAVDEFDALPSHVRAVARQIHRIASRIFGSPGAGRRLDEAELRAALLAGYPDRVAARREAGSARLLLSTGSGAVLSDESGVHEADFLLALDVRADPRGPDARVRLASRVEREWLYPTEASVEHRLDGPSGTVKAWRVERYGALTLGETPAETEPHRAAALLKQAYLQRGPGPDDRRLLHRLSFAGLRVTFEELVDRAAVGARQLADMSLSRALDPQTSRALEAGAPERLLVPSGRTVALEYRQDGTVVAAVKLQELFGLADTPRLGPARRPVVFSLLAPSGRPVQTTSDLRSFWERTYPEVRRELRGRYPKHPWPENPWTATPTARTRRRT